jgi:hypothetical protein
MLQPGTSERYVANREPAKAHLASYPVHRMI